MSAEQWLEACRIANTPPAVTRLQCETPDITLLDRCPTAVVQGIEHAAPDPIPAD